VALIFGFGAQKLTEAPVLKPPLGTVFDWQNVR